MALQRDARYPGRWTAASGGHPQGAFKNRSAPGSLDGSYIEQDWANDWDGFFSSLLSAAGVTPNGTVDAVGSSQYYTALQSAMTGRVLAVQVFTASGTYTPTAGMKTAEAYGIAGGGAGGGAPVTIAGNVGFGAGGHSGAPGRGLFSTVQIGASQAVTVGSGGVATTNSGGNGGQTSLGTLMVLPGGAGGPSAGNTAPPLSAGNGNVPSVASSGANIERGAGAISAIGLAVSTSVGYSGAGANSPWGSGGGSINNTAAGQQASGLGAGGSGGMALSANGTARLGGNGSPGFLVIIERS